MSGARSRHAFEGQLIFPDGDAVRVAISDTDEAIVLHVVHGQGLLHQHPLAHLVLESRGGSGLIRDNGSGEWIDDSTLLFKRDKEQSVTQRRGHVRIAAPQPITLSDRDGNIVLDTYTVNLSGGGMLLSLPVDHDLRTLMHDETLGFSLVLRESDPPVTGMLRVVRVRPEELQLATEFTELAPRERQRVIRFIFDRQRLAIALARSRK